LLKHGTVLFKIIVVFVLEVLNFNHVFILSILELIVPVFVKLLVLFKVGVLTLLPLLLVVKDHFFHLFCILLVFKLLYTICGDLSLYVSAFRLTHCLVFLHGNPVKQVNGY